MRQHSRFPYAFDTVFTHLLADIWNIPGTPASCHCSLHSAGKVVKTCFFPGEGVIQCSKRQAIPPQRCALCSAPFLTEDEHFKCWRGNDQRYYCCPKHAEFDLQLALAFRLGPASGPQIRYRARAFNSDCYPLKAGRSAIRVRAKNGYLLTSNLSTDGSCSLPPGQSSVRTSEIIGLFNVTRLFSLLSDSCARLLTCAASGSVEYFRQLLDPVVSASGIEIEGLGRRLVRDAYAGRFANGSHNL
jgi:hypothetical protein